MSASYQDRLIAQTAPDGLLAMRLLSSDFEPAPPPIPAGLAWLSAATYAGPEEATRSLSAFLLAGATSDDWTAALLGQPAKDIRVPPLKETLALWKKRKVVDSDTFEKLTDELKGQSGRLVDVWNTRFTEDVYASLFDAIAKGWTLPDWLPKAQALLDQYGADPSVRIFSGDTWSASYADLVFRNANAAATAGGRYAEMFSREWIRRAPYFMNDAIKDTRVRPSHLALDGIVFRKSDPAARRFLAPLGHNCRCVSLEFDQADVDEGGYKVRQGRDMDVSPDEGWDTDRVASLVPAALKNLGGK